MNAPDRAVRLAKPSGTAQPGEVRSTCPYCGVGCGVIIETAGEGEARHISGVRGDPEHPANHGRLCSKGTTLHLTADPVRQQQIRVSVPLLRKRRDEPRQPAAWSATLDHLAERFADCIATHGPDSVAFYLSGQLLTEDYYVFNKLCKALIGSNNVDTNSRLCMSSAVSGYKATLGADAPPACYEDIDSAQCLFIAGSNTAWAHPVLYRRIEAARERNPALRIIVVDPRCTETAAAADLHLPILPGTDIALYQAMLHRMLWQGWIAHDHVAQHTSGFEALRERVRECTPAWAAAICGVPAAAIEQAAQWFACSGATLSLYCQGLNQSAQGTANNTALINLHLATGQIGRAGCGPFSLTGQPNAMGGRETGGLASLLPGHREVTNDEDRHEMARFWGVAPLSARPGLPAVALFDAVASGAVKMVWIACTNPAQSLPDANQVAAALETAELVVVQETSHETATAAYADALLPAAGWGERDGTVTNSERCISRVRPAVSPWGQARADWEIAADFARRLENRLAWHGLERRLDPQRSLFAWPDAQSVWCEHRATTVGRDLDIGGLSWERLDAEGPQQWPCTAAHEKPVKRLYTDHRYATPDGRARFADVSWQPAAESPDPRYPVRLLTGRLRDQWHGMSRTGLLARAFAHDPEPVLQMHATDMLRRGLHDGDLIKVVSRRGQQVVPVSASDSLRPGSTFLAMHWGSEYLAGGSGDQTSRGVNGLTIARCDPVSFQPELKHCAVRLEPLANPHRLVAFGWLPAGHLHAVRRELQAMGGAFAYLTAVPFGREVEGVMVRAAGEAACAMQQVQALLDCWHRHARGAAVLRYDDPSRGEYRRVLLVDGRLQAVVLAGAQVAEPWLRALLESGQPVADLGNRLLLASPQPPTPVVAASPVLCNCLGVSTEHIEAGLQSAWDVGVRDAGTALAGVQQTLGCGLQCGSCLPELKRVAAQRFAAPRLADPLKAHHALEDRHD